MTNPVDVVANAFRVADGNHTMSAGQLAEVAVKAVAEHIAQYRDGGGSTGPYEQGWDAALRTILTTLGHGDR